MNGRGTLSLLASSLAAGLVACAAPADGVARGEALYGSCVSCHAENGGGDPTVGAPPIAGMSAWYVEAQLKKFRAGHRGAHPEDISGMRMRPMSQSLRDDRDISSIAAYVASLPVAVNAPEEDDVQALSHKGDPNKGKAHFPTCTACHGQDGAGNQALNAPAIAGHPEWYVAAQLAKFRSGQRGGDPADVTGVQMRAISMSLPDDAAVRDVAAYVASLPKAPTGQAGK